jgi:hypothetical protein
VNPQASLGRDGLAIAIDDGGERFGSIQRGAALRQQLGAADIYNRELGLHSVPERKPLFSQFLGGGGVFGAVFGTILMLVM